MSFVELCSYSNFSFLQGASHPEEIVQQAAVLGYTAIGVTDKNSISGLVRAHVEAQKAGIDLISGCEISLLSYLPEKPAEEEAVWITEDHYNLDHLLPLLPISLSLYPTNTAQYSSLCRLLSTGKLRAPKGHCWLTLEDCCSQLEAMHAVVHILDPKHKLILPSLKKLRDFFKGMLSVSISRTYSANESQINSTTLAIAKTFSLPLLSTNRVLYHEPSRRKLQDVLTSIRNRTSIEKAGFLLSQNSERFLKSPEEICRLFRSFPNALKRSEEIREASSNFSLDQLSYEYPEEVCPNGKSPLLYLKELTLAGARKRFPKGIPRKVKEQLQHEFSLIEELNYARYFLTVNDIVRFAKAQGILCQGRGAAANSAVCYCLGITAVDPSRTRLLLERFISKERGEPPDIDIDFEHERREEVIQYIYNKFGRERAALVSAVITYRKKSAIREVGKALSLSIDTIETLQKIFYRRAEDDPVSVEEIAKEGINPDDLRIRNCLELVDQIKGFPRHLTQHSSGFIISQEKLSSFISVENTAMPGRTMIAWDKDDIEALGMLKIDVLGLGMLTCIRKALEMVNSNGQNSKSWNHQELLMHNIPPEDPAVYDMLCAADTIGVFQVESRAQMNMLPRLKPRCFYDLVVEVAIVRPGPIQGGMVHPYLKRRKYRPKISYPSEKIKEILETTLGVPIFQEQIMELAVHGAGFSPGEADQLRRAIASWKRNKAAMSRYGKKLVRGFLERGYSVQFAKQVFRQIKGFSEYGFPQSHAASFALIVYTSSWLKKHHPAAFAAALINSQPMGFYHPSQIIQDAERHGVRVLPVDISYSDWDCKLEPSNGQPKMRLGLRLVQGLSQKEVEKITQLSRRPTELRELWKLSGTKVSSLRKLARADAFRSFGVNRQQALWQLKKLSDQSLPLFEQLERQENYESNLPVLSEKLHVLFDYQHTGHSLKAHPMEFVRERLAANGIMELASLQDSNSTPNGKDITISGLVLVRQKPPTAKGTTFLTIEDETGWANIVVQSKNYKRLRRQIMESRCLIARGKVQRAEGFVNLVAEDIVKVS